MQNAAKKVVNKRLPPVPPQTSRKLLAELSPEAYIRQLRRSLVRKATAGAKLSVVERHLAKNFSDLERNFFAPSLRAVLIRISHAFVRPAAFSTAFCVAAVASAGSLPANYIPEPYFFTAASDAGLESEASSESSDGEDAVDFVQLAMALAADIPAETAEGPEVTDASEPNIQIASLAVPKFPSFTDNVAESETETVIEASPQNLDSLRAETPAEVVRSAYLPSSLSDDERTNDLRHQRNLVKFISGLIAAFRPSIKDTSQIARHIVELSMNENIDPLYVAAVIAIESRFASQAQSHVGALGLMQLMPGTAKDVSKTIKGTGHTYRHLVDPRVNIKLGISYLKQLEKRYKGNRYIALAAYNWGPGNVDRGRRIPGSVKKYSQTVLDRTHAWREHYDNANKQADALALAMKKDKSS